MNVYLQVFVRLEGEDGESVDDVLVEQSGFFLFPTVRRRRPLGLLLDRQLVLFAAVQLMFLGVQALCALAPLAAFATLMFDVRFHVITTLR